MNEQYNTDRATAVKALERADSYFIAAAVDGKGCFLADTIKDADAVIAFEALLSAISQIPTLLKLKIILACADAFSSANANDNPAKLN